VARLHTGDFQASSEHRIHSACSGRSEPVPIGIPGSVGSGEAFRSASPPNATPSSPSAPATTTATSPAQPQIQAQQPSSAPPSSPPQPAPVAHPFRGEALRPASLPQSAAQPIPNNPLPTGPSTPQRAPNRDTHALHFDHNYRLLIDGKPF
jgi:hypothetical protein